MFYTSDLSGIPGVNNNANFAFRIVSEWEATAIGNNNSNYVATVTSYVPSGTSSGTVRFDLVSVFGGPYSASTPVPTRITNIIGTTLTYGGGGGAAVRPPQVAERRRLAGWLDTVPYELLPRLEHSLSRLRRRVRRSIASRASKVRPSV